MPSLLKRQTQILNQSVVDHLIPDIKFELVNTFCPYSGKAVGSTQVEFTASFNGCHFENGREISNFDNKSEGLRELSFKY